jgi:hypothetical protein
MSNRKRGHAIHSLVVDGAWVEGVVGIFNHFEKHFLALNL